MPSFILIRPTNCHNTPTSDTGQTDRTDRSGNVWGHRANRLTNGRPKIAVLFTASASVKPLEHPQRLLTSRAGQTTIISNLTVSNQQRSFLSGHEVE